MIQRQVLQDLAKTYNPYIEAWINYYGQFYLTHFRSTLKRIDGKYKRLRPKTKSRELVRAASPRKSNVGAYPGCLKIFLCRGIIMPEGNLFLP